MKSLMRIILWPRSSAKSVRLALIVKRICPKTINLAVSNAKLLITATVNAKLPIGKQDTRRIA